MSTLPKRSEALAIDVSCTADTLTVVLVDGRVVSVPVAWFPRLLEATPKQRAHWEFIDEDISVASLLQPENFIRLPNEPMQPARKRRRVKLQGQTARG